MDEFVKLLDGNLDYVSHELLDDVFYITVKSNRTKVICPFCGFASSKTHSVYLRSFQDLPLQGKKVILLLQNRKMFCLNHDCKHITFAERFDFMSHKAKKTRRLEDEIILLSLNCSSTAAAELLKKNYVDVGKSTICNLLKKRKNNNR